MIKEYTVQEVKVVFTGPDAYRLREILLSQSEIPMKEAIERWFDVDGETGQTFLRSASNIVRCCDVDRNILVRIGDPGERRHTIVGDDILVFKLLVNVLNIPFAPGVFGRESGVLIRLSPSQGRSS